jgi:hypothetical protein
VLLETISSVEFLNLSYVRSAESAPPLATCQAMPVNIAFYFESVVEE